mmetsp:Transcript_20101/g.57015  ORF Transcript_20101/g.57015 Transcript_20101/m.57015 type:complete len:551 (+) Transcript_20101:282-1934(+)
MVWHGSHLHIHAITYACMHAFVSVSVSLYVNSNAQNRHTFGCLVFGWRVRHLGLPNFHVRHHLAPCQLQSTDGAMLRCEDIVDGPDLQHRVVAVSAIPSVRHLHRNAARLLRKLRPLQLPAVPYPGAWRRRGSHTDAQGQVAHPGRAHVGAAVVRQTLADGTAGAEDLPTIELQVEQWPGRVEPRERQRERHRGQRCGACRSSRHIALVGRQQHQQQVEKVRRRSRHPFFQHDDGVAVINLPRQLARLQTGALEVSVLRVLQVRRPAIRAAQIRLQHRRHDPRAQRHLQGRRLHAEGRVPVHLHPHQLESMLGALLPHLLLLRNEDGAGTHPACRQVPFRESAGVLHLVAVGLHLHAVSDGSHPALPIIVVVDILLFRDGRRRRILHHRPHPCRLRRDIWHNIGARGACLGQARRHGDRAWADRMDVGGCCQGTAGLSYLHRNVHRRNRSHLRVPPLGLFGGSCGGAHTSTEPDTAQALEQTTWPEMEGLGQQERVFVGDSLQLLRTASPATATAATSFASIQPTARAAITVIAGTSGWTRSRGRVGNVQ